MNNPLITGSVAYDKIYEISEDFASKFPKCTDSLFTMPYLATSLKQHFGGCAANIAYALKKLGINSTIMATVGKDFGLYNDYLTSLGIATDKIVVLDDEYTAEATIYNDTKSNQFISFYPGACAGAKDIDVTTALPASIAIVSPNDKAGMLRYCRDLHRAGTPFIFDPGQALSAFTKEECLECIQLATYVIVNYDEFLLLENITALNISDLRLMVDALIVTRGARGSIIYENNNQSHETHAYTVREVCDTTGCGDAYRAGIIYGLIHRWDWEKTLIFSSVVGGIKAQHFGGQGYDLSYEMVDDKCKEHKK